MILRDLRLFQVTILAAVLSSCGILSNDVFFEGYGSIGGRVLVDGETVSDALVFVMGEESNTSLTGADGSFSLFGTEAGRELYLVAMWGPNLGLQQQFELAADSNRQLGDLDLVHGGCHEKTSRPCRCSRNGFFDCGLSGLCLHL
jgi:hypothetical protein